MAGAEGLVVGLTEQAVLEDLERLYCGVKDERDALQEQVTRLQSQLQNSLASQTISTEWEVKVQQITSELELQRNKVQALGEEENLHQERLDRSFAEADQLRAEIR